LGGYKDKPTSVVNNCGIQNFNTVNKCIYLQTKYDKHVNTKLKSVVNLTRTAIFKGTFSRKKFLRLLL
jgi:hypothetical protein